MLRTAFWNKTAVFFQILVETDHKCVWERQRGDTIEAYLTSGTRIFYIFDSA